MLVVDLSFPSSSPSHLLYRPPPLRVLHSFPTRRSSDLTLPCGSFVILHEIELDDAEVRRNGAEEFRFRRDRNAESEFLRDRKSTRLNSSHVSTSYAVFCLKKKTSYTTQTLAFHKARDE